MRRLCICTALLLVSQLPVAAAGLHYSLAELAGMHAARGNTAVALDTYARAIAAEPANTRIYEARAFYLLRLGQTGEAIADLSTVLAIAPKYAPGYLSRGLVYSQQGDDIRAKADFASACALGEASGCSFAAGIKGAGNGDPVP